MGVVFLICNPTILLPGTWKAMSNFTSGRMIGHDSYEFMGRLYPHKFTDWLKGEPWYFYPVLIGVKLPVLTLLGFASGFILLFKKTTGDGRYFLIFWLFFWGITFMFAGGKFTRYFTAVLPAVIMAAALGVQLAGRWLERICARVLANAGAGAYARAALASLVIVSALWSSASAMPHYRLYMNLLGGSARAGQYFPQDEFYDAYMQEAMSEIAKRASPGTRVASELPTVAAYYAQRVSRADLVCVELSDTAELEKLSPVNFVIDGRDQTNCSNHPMLMRIRQARRPAFSIAVAT